MAEFVRVPETDWQNILDATREKTGSTEKMLSGEVATAIAGITGGSEDSELVKSLIEGTAVNLAFGAEITDVKYQLFVNVTTLKTFDFTYIKTIKTEAFKGCTGLTDIYLPSVSNPNGQGARAFQNCTSLKSVIMPNFMYWYSSAPGWFAGCSALTDVNMPKLQGVTSSLFQGCTSLTKLDFPLVNSIGSSGFASCTQLKILILRNNLTATLSNINAFTGTPFAVGGTGGTVYVPQALISQYQQATNWSTLYAAGTCNFVAIEGSEYE